MDTEVRTKRTLMAVAFIGIVASLILLIMWMKAASQINEIESELTSAEERIVELEAQAASTQTAEEEPLESDVTQITEPAEAPPSESEDGAVSETSYTLVTDLISTGAGYKIKLDYVQFLTGEAAADAATAAGDEVLDFYVLNQNPKIRNYPLADDVEIKLLTGADGLEMDGFEPSIAEWEALLDGAGAAQYSSLLYVVEVENGEVKEIKEEYLP